MPELPEPPDLPGPPGPAGPPEPAEPRLLRLDHAPALLAFERENRAWFAASVPDRGEDCFTRFDERLRALPAEQEAGICFFPVLSAPVARCSGGSTSWTRRTVPPSSGTGSRNGPPGAAWPPGPYGRSAHSPPARTG